MVPSRFIALERLPQLPNGKLDRRALMIAAAAVTPSPRDRRRPATEGEQAIAAIWAELLDVPVDDIGLNDNFFAVGGDSMLAIQLVERMRRQGLHIEARALFGAPTLASIAAAVSRDDGGVEVPPQSHPARLRANHVGNAAADQPKPG
jgi:aryl carrier-like protein